MSMPMRNHTILIATCLSLTAMRSGAQSMLSCETLVGQGQERETPFLHEAPQGASRPSTHRLVVHWTGGTRTFADSAPYMMGDMSGSRYLYCGYSRAADMHLVYFIDETYSEGVLLDNATGRTLPAGEFVVFSQDKQKYFASRQPEGLDGKEWLAYSANGALIWKGLSGIEGKRAGQSWTSFIAELDNPHWNDRNQLEASLTCAIGSPPHKSATITLTRTGTTWEWLPRVDCPSGTGAPREFPKTAFPHVPARLR